MGPRPPSAFDPAGYERPTQRWVCGRTAEGRPCRIGPDHRGRCLADFECAPLRAGDRWQCTRPALAGGPCAAGPWPDGTCRCAVPPCQPVPSLRVRRGRVTFWITAATLGLLTWGLFGPFRDSIIAPGPLSGAHAAVARACAACHATGDAAGNDVADGGSQSAQCLKCHATLGPQPLAPHGVAPALLLAAGAGKPDSAGEIACARCHVEHRGRSAPLTELDDRRCQTCHAVQFAGLTRGHPEFQGYPHARPAKIAFDHASHVVHLREDRGGAAGRLLSSSGSEHAELICSACHRLDPDGSMPVPGFASTCGQCHHHGEQIRGSARIPFLRLPGLDVASLAQAGLTAGEWPPEAEGPGFDAEPTSFMRVLLGGSDLADVPLFDLYEADEQQAAAAARFAWAVKELLYDLITRREAAWTERLAGVSLDFDVGGLSGSLRADESRAARQELWPSLEALQRRWLPHLLEEVPAFRAGTIQVRTGPPRPRRVAAAAPAPVAQPLPADLDSLLEEPAVKVDLDSLLEEPPSEDDLLTEAEPAATVLLASPSGQLPWSVRDDSPRREEVDAEWEATARWSLNVRDLAVGYRVTGHGDPFLRAWLDLSKSSRDASPAARHLFEQLSHPEQGPGRCAKCHTPGTDSTASEPVESHFVHGPHLGPDRLGFSRCADCHAPVKATDPSDPAQRGRNFESLHRADCAACHRPGGARDDCLTCHRYHRAPTM